MLDTSWMLCGCLGCNLCKIMWKVETVVWDWHTLVLVLLFKEEGQRTCSNLRGITAFPRRCAQGCWRGQSIRWLNIRFRINNRFSFFVVDYWIRSLSSWGFFLCWVSCSAALQDYRLSGLLLKGYVVHVQLQRMLFLVPLKVILAAVQVRRSKINLNKTVTDGFLLTLYFTHGGNFQQICKLLTFQFFLLIVDVQHRAGSSLIYHHLLIRPLMDTDIKKTHVSIMILLSFLIFGVINALCL